MDESEQAELLSRLDQGPKKFSPVRVSDLPNVHALSDVERYVIGDLIRVPRSSGRWSLGVVAHKYTDRLRILVRDPPHRKPSSKELPFPRLAEANPLKIGDVLDLDGEHFWVVGLDPAGELRVMSKAGLNVDAQGFLRQVADRISRAGDAPTLRLERNEIDRMKQDLATEVVPPQPPLPYSPLESMSNAEHAPGLVAGNQETDTVFGLKSPLLAAGLHTNRGENYKSWNEDGGALFADKRGRIYVGVFDQAGGEGSDAGHLGAASEIAATNFFEAMQAVARGERELEEALVSAVQVAHAQVLARKRGEVTTFVGGRIDGDSALLINVGDSGAQHFDAAGQPLKRTTAHGIGRLLLEGVGMTREGGRVPHHELYRWKVSPGDYLVLGSDGFFDAKLSGEEIGKILIRAQAAKQATRALRDLISSRMRTKEAKPDNLTIVVIRIGESNAPSESVAPDQLPRSSK